MKNLKGLIRVVLAVVVALQLAACSRTVEWEEEVPLNTGETIVVKRSGTYTYKSAPGNPLDFGYGPERRSTIEFNYKGKRYRFAGEAEIWLLAVGPEGAPILVADARGWGNQNNYPCVTPYYVQFKPDGTGTQWFWPNHIDSWLYNVPTNILMGIADISQDGKLLKPVDRERQNASSLGFAKHYRMIDPDYKPENCMRRD